MEILLDTDSHSYYQIAVNPAGALADLDRGADKSARFRWESQAEVATHVADDHWIVEIRIPVTEDDNDPLNQVIGRKPSQSLPWHINICRQRMRENGAELSALSPTGTGSFHAPLKFAHFWDGRSHAFDVDETVTDWLIEYTAASQLVRDRKHEDALRVFVALADHEQATYFQKSRALANAADCARRLGEFDGAAELTDRIPLEFHAKAVRMEHFLAQRDWDSVVEQFGSEDLSQWPFTRIGAAASARGRAYHATKNGDKADADFQLALEFIADHRSRTSLLSAMARNREEVLKNDDLALEAWLRIADSTTNAGGADFYTGLLGSARILTRQQKFDEALEILDRVEPGKIGGSWAASLLLGRANTLAAAGRNDEALSTYRAVVSHPSSTKAQKETAEEAITGINAK